MKALRVAVVALFVLVGFGCGDHTPTAIEIPQQPEASLLGDLLRPTGLLKCYDLPYAQTTRTIGRDGGTISAGPHTLAIPPGALTEPTTITMTLPTGRGVNAVNFQPAGLRFERPAALTMSYSNCNLLGRLLPKRIAYTTENLEILYYLLSLDNIFSKRVTGRVDHFSDYVVAW
jgi:hypothetical protein